MISIDVLLLTKSDVMQCMTPGEAVVLAEKGIKADRAGEVVGNKFYMNVGYLGFITPFSGFTATVLPFLNSLHH